jgi:cytochrome c biogenesis protein CcdA
VFLSYGLLGAGFFKILRTSATFPVVSLIIKWALFAVLVYIGALSVRDYVIIKQGEPAKIFLQLPKSIKNRIHGFIRTGVRTEALIGGTLIMGVLVALFELGCTGQIYFPTIAYMIRVKKEALGYGFLGIYNAGFILPLVIVFVLSYFGLGSERLTIVFRRHLAKVKLATAFLFLALAALTMLFS